MSRISVFLGRRSVAVAISLALIAAFFVYGLVVRYPYVDDVNAVDSRGNDWLSYKLFALSILDGGLHIPAVQGPYYIPGGFLYNYFVALVFAVAGRNVAYVYVVHYALIALSVVLMFLFARRYLPPLLAFAYLLACALLTMDHFKDWVGRLLSENLAIAIYPVALLLIVSGVERKSTWRLAAAGAVTGALVLTRPNMAGLAILVAGILAFVAARGRQKIVWPASYLLATVAVYALLPLRNAWVTGTFLSKNYAGLIPKGSSGDLVSMIGTRLLYCAGVSIEHGFSAFAKKWLLLTILAAAATLLLIVRRRFAPPDALCVAVILAAYGPFILLPHLGAYGMRFQWPYTAVLLFLAFRLFDALAKQDHATSRTLAGGRFGSGNRAKTRMSHGTR